MKKLLLSKIVLGIALCTGLRAETEGPRKTKGSANSSRGHDKGSEAGARAGGRFRDDDGPRGGGEGLSMRPTYPPQTDKADFHRMRDANQHTYCAPGIFTALGLSSWINSNDVHNRKAAAGMMETIYGAEEERKLVVPSPQEFKSRGVRMLSMGEGKGDVLEECARNGLQFDSVDLNNPEVPPSESLDPFFSKYRMVTYYRNDLTKDLTGPLAATSHPDGEGMYGLILGHALLENVRGKEGAVIKNAFKLLRRGGTARFTFDSTAGVQVHSPAEAVERAKSFIAKAGLPPESYQLIIQRGIIDQPRFNYSSGDFPHECSMRIAVNSLILVKK